MLGALIQPDAFCGIGLPLVRLVGDFRCSAERRVMITEERFFGRAFFWTMPTVYMIAPDLNIMAGKGSNDFSDCGNHLQPHLVSPETAGNLPHPAFQDNSFQCTHNTEVNHIARTVSEVQMPST
jgi:hypothetical protein